MSELSGLMLYCRPGFEKECAAEIHERAAAAQLNGYVKARDGDGYLLYQFFGAAIPSKAFDYADLIFARQLLRHPVLVADLPAGDRIAPLLEQARQLPGPFSAVWLETADTNEAKQLSALTRKFVGPFTRAAETEGLLAGSASAPRLHLLFLTSATVVLALSLPANSAPWPMGIPRLKFPRGAPSRSTLKLEEALLLFVPDHARWLAPGMTAVDLGAAPGGWTWQLVRRHLRVVAVDNGGMNQELLDSGLVEHVRADAFRYRPSKPVDWMVCDVVEQPCRIASLVSRWVAEGWCRQTIFNLKLPMKKRYDEVKRCREIVADQLAAAGVPHRLRFKQLYHDREEVTGMLQRAGHWIDERKE